MILVDTDELCAAMKDVFEDTRAIVEPVCCARSRGREALRRASRRSRAGTSSPSLCGANMNFDRLRFVAERADLGEAREAVFAATIPERPGSFKGSAACSGGATSPSSTTASPTPTKPMSSSA